MKDFIIYCRPKWTATILSRLRERAGLDAELIHRKGRAIGVIVYDTDRHTLWESIHDLAGYTKEGLCKIATIEMVD